MNLLEPPLYVRDPRVRPPQANRSQATQPQGDQSSQLNPSLFMGSREPDPGTQHKVCSYRGDKRSPRNWSNRGRRNCLPSQEGSGLRALALSLGPCNKHPHERTQARATVPEDREH